jgi:flagellar motility protein MotE (MotC chaperone)
MTQQLPQQQRPSDRPSRGRRIRLAPIVMIAVLATISVKANHLWQGLSISFGRPSQAQAANNQSGQQPSAAQNGAPAAGQANGGQAGAAQQTAQIQPPAPSSTTPPAAGQGGTAPVGSSDAQSGQDLLAQDQQRKLARDPFNYTDEEVDVLQQLAKRRVELDQRARQLDEREALVKAAEQRMDQKMAELKALQATVQDLLKQRNAADEQQLQSLVKIYENMKPKAAAQIFEEMDMDVLLDVVSRMNERKVSPILAMVSPTRAKELTFELAQRRQMPIPQ